MKNEKADVGLTASAGGLIERSANDVHRKRPECLMRTFKPHPEEIAAGNMRVWHERRSPKSGCHLSVGAVQLQAAGFPSPQLGFIIIQPLSESCDCLF